MLLGSPTHGKPASPFPPKCPLLLTSPFVPVFDRWPPPVLRRRAYLGAEETKPIRRQVAALAREFGVADRRSNRLEPEREPEQLALGV